MAKIVFDFFTGANSRVDPELLPNGFAVEATNVYTESGSLNVWKDLKDVSSVGGIPWNSKTGTLTSLFYMDNSLWLAWAGARVDVAMMQKASNLDWEVMFTGTDKPRYTNRLWAISGGGHAYPEVSFPVGVPVPTTPLVATVSDKSTASNSVRLRYTVAGTMASETGDRIARVYVYTFVNDAGREGAPSDPSNTVYSNDDEKVTLTSIPAVPSDDINKIRVYVAASGGTFNYLKEITLPATSDEITDNSFGDAIATTLYSPPNDNMIGVTAMANGILAGFYGNDLYFSEPYQSHAWPEDYKKSMDYPIKGLAAYGNMLYISTEGYPVIATGNAPAYMTFTKLGEVQACQSRFTMVCTSGGAMYAANDGVVSIAGGEATMISEGIISKRIFQFMNPSTMHSYFYRGKYIGFYDSGETLGGTYTADTGEIIPNVGAFVLDPKMRNVTYLDVTCDCAYSDKVTGKLFIVKNEDGVNNLYEFDEGSVNIPFSWTTRPTITPKTHFSVAKVRAERYPIAFSLYTDGTLRYSVSVTSEAAFRLPGGYRANEWAVHVTGDSILHSITLSESMAELN